MNTIVKKQQPYGSWKSSLTAEVVTTSSASLGVPVEYQGCILATESRPLEAGRVALVAQCAEGGLLECLPTDFSIRTRVHEYGGRSWWAGAKHLYFCNWSNQRLYSMAGEVTNLIHPKPITPEPLSEHGLRFADGMETPDGVWVIAVAEIHGKDQTRYEVQGSVEGEAANVIVAVPTDGSAVDNPHAMKVLATGADFMSNPRVSLDGEWLSWVQWHHPNMPWDSTELMVGKLTSNLTLVSATVRAGGDGVSIVGPNWVQDGRLVFSSDESGWWNLHALDLRTGNIDVITHLSNAEIGSVAWAIGTSRFCEIASSDQANDAPWLLAAVTGEASDWLAVVYRDGTVKRNAIACTCVRGITATTEGGAVALLEYNNAESTHCTFSAAELRQGEKGRKTFAKRSSQSVKFEGSTAEAIRFASAKDHAHAFFYAPRSSQFQGTTDELPPLIVMGHGGPTSHATPSIRLAIQYWTSRGFAVADVNYRGSSGFGRHYRQGLNEAWGVADVEDCVHVVEHLSSKGRVDPKRCVIRGGSAGGFTVLRALQVSDVFAAGVSLYGVADLESLLAETHKFESRYLDKLIGSYAEHPARYKERSPIYYANDINVPLLVLQGAEDKVVPPSQSEAIVKAVSDQKLAHAYVLFEGEQHGWRQASTSIRALELELWFYGAALNFKPHDGIEAPAEAKFF